MGSTEAQITTATKLKRIAWLSSRDQGKQFDCLTHLIDAETLGDCFRRLDGRKAAGEDGITKAQYGEQLDRNIDSLLSRMRRMAYRPGPVRQVLIPKDDKPNALRPLGISNFEDKLVQGAMAKVLESVYEPLFLDCSFGFRPGRGCHDAIRALHSHLYKYEVATVIDVDISGYFDTIDHNLLLKVLSKKIKDKRFLRYLRRMFKSGVLAQGDLLMSDEGVPQGSLTSPILANIFAHYVIDQWFETVVKDHCNGRVEMFRYADDMVVCCEHDGDADRVYRALEQRLNKFGLALNAEKTQRVPFSKRAQRLGQRQGVFDFLGFTIYLGRARRGGVLPKLKTSSSRIRVKLKRVKAWLRFVSCRQRIGEWWPTFCTKLQGHIQYFGVSFNLTAVRNFIHHALRIAFRVLNRRSQRRSFTWDSFRLYVDAYGEPRVRVCHRLW